MRSKRNDDFRNMVGKKFGKLLVVEFAERDKYRNYVFWCVCDCNPEVRVKAVATRMRAGYKISCGCSHWQKKSGHFNWKGYEDISSTHWTEIKTGAKQRNLEFNITIEQAWELYLEQSKKCALTGIDIYFEHYSHDSNRTASLDRIDSNRGYTIDNIQWVHKTVNKIKQNLSDEEFIDWCGKITEYNNNKNNLI